MENGQKNTAHMCAVFEKTQKTDCLTAVNGRTSGWIQFSVEFGYEQDHLKRAPFFGILYRDIHVAF
ncbi:MAG: hypothetical protein HYZ24_08910 [Chloroflexi bacterium]|nr:hypothetical protein [Chloroflexota bacterium]